MGRRSVKEDKNIYQTARERLNLSRAQACELMESVSESRLYRIESDETIPYPDEVYVMANAYKMPSLCNYYCANDCPLGQVYVPQVEVKQLPVITLEMIAILNRLEKEKERLIEITVDGKIDPDELADFTKIRSELGKMSMAIDSLQLWIDNTIAAGEIKKTDF